MLRIKSVRNASYNRDSTINCEIQFEGEDTWLPYTSTGYDNTPHGKILWNALKAGEHGQVSEFRETETDRENARRQKNDEVNAWRNAMETAGYTFEHNGRKWDYGKSTQARLIPSVAAARAGILPLDFFWTDAQNNDVPVTAEQLIALSEAAEKAMFTKGMEIHIRQRNMKKEIAALNDVAAILAYKVGWGKETDA
ncbi:DUF4376 domain-containing protein [Escherichia coli]|nr:DUF4376 domain-containing protein [Escherichia coli]EEX1986367.1 DUF4376 domain-containing protein [Escherichia coli]EFL9211121.1 DUF4376 domain-containing protein [Escherichia coli]EGT1034143.1 DUF4376 domain-containing protein [Escherichia coli]